MRKSLFIGIAIVALLATASALRLRDAPYIAYVGGHRAAATEGLSQKAERGDGFASFLVATNYAQNVMGTDNREKALYWYLRAARSNEIRAIVPFIDMTLRQAPATADLCRAYVLLLDQVGRTGELAALLTLGRWYQTGLCVETSLAMALRYYKGAVRIDRRFYELADAITVQLGADTADQLTPLPDAFDLAQSAALAQFLAAAPALR